MIKFEKISENNYAKFIEDTENVLMSSDQKAALVEYFKKDLPLPKRSTKESAGYDFYAPKEIIIEPNQKVKLGSGIKVCLNSELPLVLFIVPRSSIGIKRNIVIANTIGVIDKDYYNNEDNEGHIMFVLKNTGDVPIGIKKGERFAQGIILQYFTTTDDSSNKTRIGGIGSTDKQERKFDNKNNNGKHHI